MKPLNSKANGDPEDKIIKTPNLQYTPEPGGMGKTFFSKMLSHGDAVAQIDGLTGEQDSYKSLLKRCIRAAVGMGARGVKSGDIVTTCSFNNLNSCVPSIAGLFLGAVPANLDPTISLADTIYLLKQVCPKIIFVGKEAIELIENALLEAGFDAEIVIFGHSTKHTQFSEFLSKSPAENGFTPVETANLKETAVIFFSSGTTGLPKGICLNHFGLLSQGFQIINLGFNISVNLPFSSLYWISSVIVLTSSILSKGARVIAPRFDPDAAWTLTAKHKVTMTFLAPSQAIAMYKKGRPEGISTENFSHLLIGGGPISAEQLTAIRGILPQTKVVLAYAQTELSGATTCFLLKNQGQVALAYQKPESSGKPVPGMTYKIVDPDTEEILGPNQKGELRVKTDFQMNGYYNMDSSSAWDADGFIKTGDVGYYDEDHCFYIVDRIKEMLKFQSWHVSPAKLEGALLTHPAVESAVVIGLPHPEDGDHPMGLVVLRRSCIGTVTPEEIKKHVEEKILDDRQKLRGGLKIIGNIPVTPTGKVKRNELRDMVLKTDI